MKRAEARPGVTIFANVIWLPDGFCLCRRAFFVEHPVASNIMMECYHRGFRLFSQMSHHHQAPGMNGIEMRGRMREQGLFGQIRRRRDVANEDEALRVFLEDGHLFVEHAWLEGLNHDLASEVLFQNGFVSIGNNGQEMPAKFLAALIQGGDGGDLLFGFHQPDNQSDGLRQRVSDNIEGVSELTT